MGKKVKYISNAPLEVGDKIILVKMDDPNSTVSPGMMGTVTKIDDLFGDKIYRVHWVNDSRLGIVDGVDEWKKITKVDDDSPINENKIILVRTKKDILNKNF